MDMNGINEVIAVQKAYKKVYTENRQSICGINERKIHLTEKGFLENFKEYTAYEFSLDPTVEKLVAYKDDVEFICLSPKKGVRE